MAIYKRAHIRGIAYELGRQGVVVWPSKYAELEAADEVADAMTDEEFPEGTDETGASEEEVARAAAQLIDVAEKLKENLGPEAYVEEDQIAKEAAEADLDDVAFFTADLLLEKVAEELAATEGPIVPGEGAPDETLDSMSNEAKIDASITPSAQAMKPQEAMDNSKGMVGAEEVRADQPGATMDPPKEVTAEDLQALLQGIRMFKQAQSDVSLTGGPTPAGGPAGRVDIPDNTVMTDLAPATQGDASKVTQKAEAEAGKQEIRPDQPGAAASPAVKTDPQKEASSREVSAEDVFSYLNSALNRR
jgi:hypothetical protein